MAQGKGPILIAGGGIAGLTAALALAAEGFDVRVFEAAPAFSEIGAGLQLSPNATRILERLGVLDALRPLALQPDAIDLRTARTLKSLTRIPLGLPGEARWGAPYLVAKRAVLQNALRAAIADQRRITVTTGAQVRDVVFATDGLTLSIARDGTTETVDGSLLVGADGVWSGLRRYMPDAPESHFAGLTAWRLTLTQDEVPEIAGALALNSVTACLDPAGHLVAYPLGREAVNLVAITPGGSAERGWEKLGERQPLDRFLGRLAGPLEPLARQKGWTRWPLYATSESGRWTTSRMVLIGDAAHAMLPFAAQGAAMAIEDASVLAHELARIPGALDLALKRYEAARRPRIAKVIKRGRLNRLAWHAAGPIATARNLVLRAKGPERLAADLDWLYGWKAPEPNAGSG